MKLLLVIVLLITITQTPIYNSNRSLIVKQESYMTEEEMRLLGYPVPSPTALPTTYGSQSYIPASSLTNPMASNYQIPASSTSSQLNAYGTPLYASSSYPTTDNTTRIVDTNVLTGAFPQATPEPGPAPSGQVGDNTGTPDNSAYEQLLRDLQDKFGSLSGAYNSGMGYFNSARDALGRKRNEFNTDYSNKNQDIFEGYQSGRGTLQGASRGMDAMTINSLLSRGAGGGSLQDSLIAKNQQQRYNKLGDLVNNRNTNDRGNQAVLDQNKNWAQGQEGQINQQQGDLQRNYQEGEQALRSQSLGSLSQMAEQAQAQRAALAASMGQINQSNLASYAPSMIGQDLLTNINASLMGGQTGGTDPNANININPNLSLLEQEKLRRQQLGFD